MTAEERVRNAVAAALAEVEGRLLYPARYDERTGRRKYGLDARRATLLEPEKRLAARLTLLLALDHYRLRLMKEILADTEAIDAAKKEHEKGKV